MKIIYMGTPDFAVPALKALANSEHEVCAVFTQPDKPRGRKMIMTPPDVKVCAEKLNIPVYQPETFKDGKPLVIINKYNPDVIVVAAYGKILPKSVLDSAKYGCINLHGSLLPKYRGASPIQQSVLNGDRETGVTAMQMDVGLDTGDILKVVKTEIGVNETSGELFDRLSLMGGELILDTLSALEKGEITPIKQDESLATHTSKIDKSLCPIDFTKSAFEVHNKIRGLNPWPSCYTGLQGKMLKIWDADIVDAEQQAAEQIEKGRCGQIVLIDKNRLWIQTGDGCLSVQSLQLAGKKRMNIADFLRGMQIDCGTILACD